MTKWRRRSVLATGATLTAGGIFASIGAGEGTAAGDLPDPTIDPNPGLDEDWPSFDGDAGHARYVPDGPALEGEALEDVWTVDTAINVGVAVADGVVYARTADGVAALDAADGSTIWETTGIDASAPSVVGDTLYIADDELFALDVADGSIRWQTEFEPEDRIASQTVAYDTVFVVADGTLYALEPADGSVRWEHESIAVEPRSGEGEAEQRGFVGTTAAANGVVYAGAVDGMGGVTAAFDPETGEEVWSEPSSNYGGQRSQTRVTATAVTAGRASYYARHIADAQTGEELEKVSAEGISVTLGEELYLGGYEADALVGRSIHGDEYGWEVAVARNVGDAAIVGDTVYVYFRETMATYGEYNGELVALEKDDGSERWTVSTDDLPVGEVLAVSGDTIYVERDGNLVALREETDEEGDTGEDEGEEEPDGDGDEQDESDESDDDGQPDGEGEADDDEAQESAEGEDEEDDQGDDQYGGEEDDEDETDDSVDDTDDGDDGVDDNGDEGIDDDPNGDDDPGVDDEPDDDDGDDAVDDADDEDGSVDADDGDDPNDETADDEADSVPGFTTGAGIAGGVLGLEWLRRRAATDASAESTDERTVPADDPEN
ncbi:PQQ-binding-like beta-propeller repeat protein [Natronococcus sp.]|uniref:outer membrane protein assembly factor BamB family protein n=1 Tax=Natronococcus sp. TaxID=35747 RepID=UPI003A4D2FDA